MELLTRRVSFKYMAVLGLVTWSTTPLHAKVSKDTFKYQDMPNEGKRCSDCVYFLSDTKECKMVEGIIDPDGWCRIYQEKK